MALIMLGKSVCPLCGEIMKEGDEIISFTPFVSNPLDKLYFAHDAGFHQACFDQHPLAGEVMKRYQENRERVGRGKRYCVICGEEITHPNDYFCIFHLTDDPTNELFQYNYLQFHKIHLPLWEDLDRSIVLIEKLRNSGVWGGRALDFLLKDLRAAQSNN